MDTVLDTTPVKTAELMRLYNIQSRTTLNNRLNQLGFKSFSVGRETFVYQWQKDILDKQDAHIRKGLPMHTFNSQDASIQSVDDSVDESDELIHSPGLDTAPNVLDGLTRQPIQVILAQQPASSPLSPQHQLSECVAQGYTLHTEQLLEILGKARCPASPYYYGGFVLTRHPDHKHWWRVAKEI